MNGAMPEGARTMDTTGAASRFETLLYVKKGSTAYVTLNRPKVMNALNQKAIAELTEVFTDSRDDSSIRGGHSNWKPATRPSLREPISPNSRVLLPSGTKADLRPVNRC